MPLQGYKPQQIKSKHLFSCICLEEEEEKKKRKPNPKPKLNTMNDKNIVYKKNKKNYLSLYFIILIPSLLRQIPGSATDYTKVNIS